MRFGQLRLSSRRALVAASVAVIASGLAAVAVSQAHAASGCTVAYQVQNDWGAGATVNLTITNNDPAITSWTVGFAFPSGQTVTNGWNATYTQTGANVTAASLSYNGSLATGASTSTGFNLADSGTNTAPTTFTLNGQTCNGGGNPPPTTNPPTTNPPTTNPTTNPPTTNPPTTTPPTTTPSTPPGTHVANPFVGAAAYLNPDYTAEVSGVSGGSLVAKWATGIWMDRKAAIAGGNGRLSLTQQMDNALAKAASGPVTIEIVIYDLPGRDCAALASNGEIPATAAGLTDYENNYITPIASIFSTPKYVNSNLRVVTIIEPDSLPNAVTNPSLPACGTSAPLYEQGIEFALNKLHAINNVYTYVDAAHSAWLGWPSNLPPAGQEFAKVARGDHRRLQEHRRVHQRHRELHAGHGALPAQPDHAGRRAEPELLGVLPVQPVLRRALL